VWLGSVVVERIGEELIADLTQSFPRALQCFTTIVEAGTIPPDEPDVRIKGLSNHAAKVARFIARTLDHASGDPPHITWEELEAGSDVSDRELRDAIKEVERLGLVKSWGSVAAPHGIMSVAGTARLATRLGDAGLLAFTPKEDARSVCRVLLDHAGMVATAPIFEATKLSSARFNFARNRSPGGVEATAA
jgi:hypothetical protein